MDAHLHAQLQHQTICGRTQDREVNFQQRTHTLESTTDGDDDQQAQLQWWEARLAQNDARMTTALAAKHGRGQGGNQIVQSPNMIGRRRLSSPLANQAEDNQNSSNADINQTEFQESYFLFAAAGAMQANEGVSHLGYDAVGLTSSTDMHSPTSPMYDNRNSFEPGYTAVGGSPLSPTMAPHGEEL